jgi:hypothetical protein
MADFKTHAYLTDRDGGEHEIPVRVSYDCDYQAAFISGPPEDCYPEAGDMEITDIEALGELPQGFTDDDLKNLDDAEKSRIEDEAWDHYHSRGVDD